MRGVIPNLIVGPLFRRANICFCFYFCLFVFFFVFVLFCFLFYLKKHSQEAEKRGKDEKNIYGKEENKHIFMNEKRKVKKKENEHRQ